MKIKCRVCDGSGEIYTKIGVAGGRHITVKCPNCDGGFIEVNDEKRS